jgi:hypothetical protein
VKGNVYEPLPQPSLPSASFPFSVCFAPVIVVRREERTYAALAGLLRLLASFVCLFACFLSSPALVHICSCLFLVFFFFRCPLTLPSTHARPTSADVSPSPPPFSPPPPPPRGKGKEKESAAMAMAMVNPTSRCKGKFHRHFQFTRTFFCLIFFFQATPWGVGHSIDDIFFFFRGSFVSFYCGFVGWLIGWSFAANPRLMKL